MIIYVQFGKRVCTFEINGNGVIGDLYYEILTHLEVEPQQVINMVHNCHVLGDSPLEFSKRLNSAGFGDRCFIIVLFNHYPELTNLYGDSMFNRYRQWLGQSRRRREINDRNLIFDPVDRLVEIETISPRSDSSISSTSSLSISDLVSPIRPNQSQHQPLPTHVNNQHQPLPTHVNNQSQHQPLPTHVNNQSQHQPLPTHVNNQNQTLPTNTNNQNQQLPTHVNNQSQHQPLFTNVNNQSQIQPLPTLRVNNQSQIQSLSAHVNNQSQIQSLPTLRVNNQSQHQPLPTHVNSQSQHQLLSTHVNNQSSSSVSAHFNQNQNQNLFDGRIDHLRERIRQLQEFNENYQPLVFEDVRVTISQDHYNRLSRKPFREIIDDYQRRFPNENPYDQCPILGDKFLPETMVIVLGCGHYFSDNGLRPWLTEQSIRCPCCNADVRDHHDSDHHDSDHHEPIANIPSNEPIADIPSNEPIAEIQNIPSNEPIAEIQDINQEMLRMVLERLN